MVRVQPEDFDVASEIQGLSSGKSDIGSIVTFIGKVRKFNNKQELKYLSLEHYPGMTEKQLTKIETEARQRWRLDNSIIIHRFGRLLPSEKIVMVATASRHRRSAFEACSFIVDTLKTEAPFWKLEVTSEGEYWVEPISEIHGFVS